MYHRGMMLIVGEMMWGGVRKSMGILCTLHSIFLLNLKLQKKKKSIKKTAVDNYHSRKLNYFTLCSKLSHHSASLSSSQMSP